MVHDGRGTFSISYFFQQRRATMSSGSSGGPGGVGMALVVWTVALMTCSVAQQEGLHQKPTSLPSSWTMEERPLDTLADLDLYMDDLVDQARLHISKAFTEESRRYRRAMDLASINVTDTHLATLKIKGTARTDDISWKEWVTGLELLTQNYITYWILGAPRSEYQRIVAWSAIDQSLKILSRFQLTSISLDKVNRIAAHAHNGFLFLALGSSSSRLVSIVCVNAQTGQLRMPHTILSRGIVGGLHLFHTHDDLYLVIGEHYYTTPDDDLTHSAMYVLVGEYFDLRDGLQLKASGVRDIAGFPDGTSYYLIFGMKSSEGSHVYEFNPVLDTITLIQQLPDTDVLKVDHYSDLHDDKHYVLLLSHDSGKIYWWRNNQLQKWQELEYSENMEPSSVGILTLHNLENIIIISNGATITLYTDDLTGHYVASFTVDTTCVTVHDLHGVKLGPDYYILYVCSGAVSRLEARVLHLEDVVLGEVETGGDPLLRCLTEVTSLLDQRKRDIAYLEDVITSDSLMTVDHPQVWSGPVSFPELSVSGTSIINQTVNIRNPLGESSTSQSLEEYLAAVTRLQTEVQVLKDALPTVLYHSGKQNITGSISAVSLTVDNVLFDGVTVHKVNGHLLANIMREFLLDDVDQSIHGTWRANFMSVDVFTTRSSPIAGTISGVLTKDYMRKSVRDQQVVGHHTYKTLVAEEISHPLGDKSVNINGIDTSTIVTRGANVTFLDKKTFTNLKINGDLNAEEVNNVDVSQLARQVVYTDHTSRQTLVGNYDIGHILVRGNVVASSVNGIDLVELDNSVVKKHGNYRLAGGLVYKDDVVVTGSVQTDTINGELWSSLVDRSSPDKITSTYHFREVLVTGSLDSNSINELDLSQEVMLVDTVQRINGRIKFVKSVSVGSAEGVVMEEGGTVNGVDPSSLQAMIADVEDIIIEEEVNFTSPLLISGDVTAVSINNLVLEGLGDRYWRKSTNQDITIPVQLQSAVFEGAVVGETLNGHKLSDYLHKSGQESIFGDYIFQGQVFVQGDLIMDEGSLVNNVDVSELKDKVVTLDGYQTITGLTNFLGKVSVIGDLDLKGRLNGLDIATDLMRLDKHAEHTGALTFANTTVMTSLDLVNSGMTVKSLNGLDVEAAANDLVLVDQDATITGGAGLRFTGDVHVRELTVSGLVDGVDIENMTARALKKSSLTPQHVTSRITIENDIHFNEELSLSRVNGEDWIKHLNNVVQQDYSGKIFGHKIFTQLLFIEGNFNPTEINDIDVSTLATRILRRSGKQVIDGVYTFIGDVTAKDLYAPVIDGIDMDSIMLVDESGRVGGQVTFAEDLNLLDGLTSDTNILDGCNLVELQNRAIWKDEGDMTIDSKAIIETLIIEGNVTSGADITVVKSGNKVDVKHFLNTLVLKSSDQSITAKVQFLNDMYIGHLQVDTIDGVNIDELYRSTVLQSENVVIKCDVSFTKGLTVRNLLVKSALSGRGSRGVLVNGVDVSEVENHAVLTSGGPLVITGRKSFTNAFTAHHLVAVSVDGIAVDDLVVVGRDDVVAEDIVFTAPISILGDLLVTGLVDGQNLDHLFSTRVTLDGTQTLFGSYVFETVRVEGDLEVDAINDISISDVVLKYGSQRQVVSGTKVLHGGLHVGGDILATSVNGLDFLELNRTLVRLDQNATIQAPVTFEDTVTCLLKVDVKGTVNKYDLSELGRNVSKIKDRISENYHRIDNLLSQFGYINEENYESAKGMYAELSFLERVRFPRDTEVYGKLWVGRIPAEGDSLFLKIISCLNPPCVCNSECYYYTVKGNSQIEAVTKLGFRVDIVNHPLNEETFVAIYSSCKKGLPTASVDIDYYTGSSPVAAYHVVGIVSDTGLFISNGMNYLVLMLQFVKGADTEERTIIFVLKLDAAGKRVIKIWSKETLKKAVTIDLTFIDDTWFMLVANDHDPNNLVDPYTVTSELFAWDSFSESFNVVAEYVADHTTSGMFLTIDLPVKEIFFTLAQLKAADSPRFDDNIKYTAKVLMFRYNKTTKNFEAFQSLAAYGVVDQAVLRVDNTVYLLLVSTVEDSLYVYEYYHPEGFLLLFKITVEDPYSLLVLEVEDGTFVVVSTPHGLVRFKVHTKGVDPDLLLL